MLTGVKLQAGLFLQNVSNHLQENTSYSNPAYHKEAMFSLHKFPRKFDQFPALVLVKTRGNTRGLTINEP
jgi:hypothetical protein